MEHVRLAIFIEQNMEAILQAWEDFARSIEPPALTMDDEELRDHARQMLDAISQDLRKPQTELQQSEKAKGRSNVSHHDSAAEVHAEARLLSGYTVVQLVSEYRALRSSVLTLWSKQEEPESITDMRDVMRFNEAIDQALAESVARYEKLIKQTQNMFLAILGHDLRNPLGTIVTATSYLMQGTDIPAKYVLVATRMFNSGKRMSRLIDDLIDFTRSHLGAGIPIKAQTTNLSRVCRDIVEEHRTFHADRMIELNETQRIDAFFDEGRIAQVISNLIGNAVQYGDDSSPISVTLTKDETNACVAVTNRGPIIEPGGIAAIFDPFVRIAATNGQAVHEQSSLGIGLFIARQIAHAHHGALNVTSTQFDGTTFTLTVPLRGSKE